MTGGRHLLVKIDRKRLLLTYQDQRYETFSVLADILEIEQSTSAAGQEQVHILAREVAPNGTEIRRIPYHRIVEIKDATDGSVAKPVSAHLEKMIRDAGGTPPKTWPKKKRFTRNVDPKFTSSGHPLGWAFGVSPFHEESLDITVVHYPGTRTRPPETVRLQGDPPDVRFRAGDVFYSPHVHRREKWQDWLRRGNQVLQVISGTDHDGNTDVRIFHITEGRMASPKRYSLPQQSLFLYLKHAEEIYLKQSR